MSFNCERRKKKEERSNLVIWPSWVCNTVHTEGTWGLKLGAPQGGREETSEVAADQAEVLAIDVSSSLK